MIDLTRAPVVRILVPFAGGSLAGYLELVTVRPVAVLFISFLTGLAVVLCFVLAGRKPGDSCRLFTPLIFLLNLWIGIGCGVDDRPMDPELPVNKRTVITGRILELSLNRQGRIACEMDLFTTVAADTSHFTPTRIKAIMDIPPDSVFPVAGETWMLTGRLTAITTSGNPGELDYAAIMKRKNCWYRFYGDSETATLWHRVECPPRRSGAAGIRKRTLAHWDGPPSVVQLLGAVCLGDRTGLSEDLLQSYSRAGGMHVLAVSGLHVGLIWWVLHRLFSILVRLSGKEIFRVVLITALLWFYAWLTGFSSSVSRSVAMFTLLSLSKLMNQRGPPVNVILVSMFFMLVIHPGRMLDVGFQLSYAAVLAIVTIHPFFIKLISVKNKALKWAWEATGVSLAAQLGTLPLVIHYFHQIPVYALLTNLLVLPLLSCIIALFVISVPFMVSGIATGAFNFLLMMLGGWMNKTMEMVADLPGSVLGMLFMGPVATLFSLALVFLGIGMLKGKGILPKTAFLLVLSLLLSWSSFSHLTRSNSKQLVVGHFFKNSLITFREGSRVDHYIWCFDPSSLFYVDRYLQSAWGQRGLEVSVMVMQGDDPVYGGISACCPLGKGMWLVGNSKIKGRVVSGNPAWKVVPALSNFHSDFLLLSGEPFLENFHREILFQESCEVIADGTNRNWYTNQLQAFGVQAHITRVRGAYQFHY